ncbi:YggU family protein [Candidatus Woesearchaeota archaeon]|nr:YggU family protein [Candidatus Woesearchaeota archaeon]
MEKIKVIVKPNSGKNEISYDEERKAYVVRIKASPHDGKANIELLKFLHKHFKKRAEIITGATSREKIIGFQ